MTEEYINNCISHINEIIEEIQRSGRTVRAKGEYLELEDILEVELSDKKIS